MSKLTFVDVTLRDGNHSLRQQFTPEIVAKVAAALDAAGVDIIEVGHGDGVGGSSIHVGRTAAPYQQLLSAVVSSVKKAKVAIMLLPGFGTKDDLQQSFDLGATVARVASHATEADVTEQHMQLARKLGMFAVGYLVSFGMASPQRIVEEAKKMESYGAQYVNLAESQGYLVPSQVKEYVYALREALSIPVGFHGHNNLGLAIGNSMAAVDAGATYVDGSLKSLGGGAGNTQSETLIAALKRGGFETNVDLFGILDAASVLEEEIKNHPNLAKIPKPVVDNDAILMGYACVYGGYIMPIKRAAQEYGCDPRQLVLRLGERKVVATQEDVVIEEARRLAGIA
jgi:4-hydroxy 2-oxovalerate aldolase